MKQDLIMSMDMYRVKIKSLAYGGYGVCRIDNKVCFVPYGLPGDEALIGIERESKGVLWGSLLEIISESDYRYDPICTAFGECGGCHWLNLDYNEQLRWKKQIVDDALIRIANIADPPTESAKHDFAVFGYRTRAQFHFRYTKDDFFFGFYKYKSRHIVDLKVCPLLDGGLNDLIYPVREALKKLSPLKSIGTVEITRNPFTEDTLAFIKLSKEDYNRYGELASALGRLDEVNAVDYPGNPTDKVAFDIAIKSIKAWVPPGSFSQSSFDNNRILVDLVVESSGDVRSKNVVDLYCGWGNLSLPLAELGATVIGLDSDTDAIDAANLTVFDNRLNAATYKSVGADKILDKFRKLMKVTDIVLLDPPRVGAKVISDEIATSSAKKIIYVSCDPNTLARDIKTMIGKGRKLVKSYVLDMIPHTYHIETVNIIE